MSIKKLFSIIVGLAVLPIFASAQMNVVQGGTGLTSVPTNFVLLGNNSLHLQAVATSSLGLQSPISLTTTGTSGVATFIANVLNIPNYTSSGGGSGTVSTSSSETATYIPFWTSTNGTPALLSGGSSSFTFDSLLSKFTVTNASTTNLSIGVLSGLLKQTGGVVVAAVSGTDYQPAGNYITALTGDLTASGPGSSAATLATVNSNVGSFTNASITVNGKGLITAAANGTSQNNYKEATQWATAAALPANTYSNGSSGVGATLTGNSIGVLTIDGNLVSVGDRVLVKNEGTASHNGIYVVSTDSSLVSYVLTRTTDFDQSADIMTGDAVFTVSGSANAATTWAYTGIDSPTLGTTSLTFAQIAGQGSFTAGNGISISGTTISQDFSFGGTYTGANIFNNITRSTTTQATTTTLSATTASTTNQYVSSLGTAAGTFVAADPSGKLIATTTPSSSATTVSTLVPMGNYVTTLPASASFAASSNTTAYVGQVIVPFTIIVNKVSIAVPNVTTAGILKLGLYSESGQTLIFSTTTSSISSISAPSSALSSPVTVSPGIYYTVVVPVGTSNISVASWGANVVNGADLNGSIAGKPVLSGTVSVSAGTLPASFIPSSITQANNDTPVFRLDN